MAVYINFKICDNASECGGIEACPTKALTWDEEKETIKIDNDKCISCGKCEKECPIGAIRVGKTEEECKKIEREIDEDIRATKDLFVDRYGAAPLSEFFMIESSEIEEKVEYTLDEKQDDFEIEIQGKDYIVSGPVVDNIMRRVNIQDRESMHYLEKRLESAGIYNELRRKGIKEGDTVKILDWEFEWYN